MSKNIEKIIANTFNDVADAILTGKMSKSKTIAITGIGSELSEENILEGAKLGSKLDVNIKYIGSLESVEVDTIKAKNEEECHKIMDNMLSSKEVDAVVTLHYPFPIGIATVGRVIAPSTGKEIFIATTTGSSSSNRVEAMVKNAIYGIICAKSCGVKNPTVGILNIDGARQTESFLKELSDNGYNINFANSKRSDGGMILRGNDILMGSCDVIVTDSLTGNIIIKMLSSYTTGGNFESVGYGYGPGVSENFDKLIMIISRASGTPVVEGAIKYARDLLSGNYFKILKEEFEKANNAGLKNILEKIKSKAGEIKTSQEIKMPPKEVVIAQISGIEIMELDDAVSLLWSKGVYAESGMGCTGPIVLISEQNLEISKNILKENNYI